MSPWPALAPRRTTVTTEDGTALHAEVHGAEDATGTIVLAHGYELDCRLWARQVAAILEARPDLRVVTYDHRGHGSSGPAPHGTATLARLGRDLRSVLDSLPAGPVAVVGHSMGGMSVMAFAEQFPSYVGDRVVAVGLVGTSSGGLSEVTFGVSPRFAAVAAQVVPRFNAFSVRREQRGRAKPNQPGMRWLLFGTAPDRVDVLRALTSLADCPAATCEAFYWTLKEHDRTATLGRLSGVPVLIACGDRDRLTPLEHSRIIADALPHAQLVVYPGCGHMVMLERADDLSRRLLDLVATALPTAAQRVG
jgi:pimeloyl-ACP methyl ester carboxylesterase